MSIIDILRTPKFADFVIFDWTATLLSAVMMSGVFSVDAYMTFIILIIVSIFLHIIFKIDTKTNWILGLSEYPLRDDKKNIL